MSEVSTITARTGNVQAMAFAAKGGVALNALLSSIADTKAAERMGAIHAMAFLVTHFSDDEQHAIPVVGSKQGETGNLPFDKYTAEITTADGKRKVPASWYTDVIRATDEYERIKRVQRWLSGDVTEGETVPDDIAAIAKTGAGNEMKATLGDRISDMRVGLTRGSMLFHHCEAVSAINPARIKVKMPWRPVHKLDANGERVMVDGAHVTELKVTGSKIRLQDPTGEFEDKIYSVSSFLQLKPDNELFAKLADDAKTIVELDKTTARAPKGGDKDKDKAQNNAKVPTTLEGGLTLFNALSSWVDQETDEGEKVYNKLLAKMASKDADAAETIMSVGKLCLTLDALWTIIRPAYNRLNEQKAAAAMATAGTTATAATK